MSKIDIVESTGNVFIDLGFPPEEAAILQMRADLMADLRKLIKAKRLTQVKAAKILGVSQSRVRTDSRQMGAIQPGNADYAGNAGRHPRPYRDGGVEWERAGRVWPRDSPGVSATRVFLQTKVPQLWPSSANR